LRDASAKKREIRMRIVRWGAMIGVVTVLLLASSLGHAETVEVNIEGTSISDHSTAPMSKRVALSVASALTKPTATC
jgi:hypothetical protein